MDNSANKVVTEVIIVLDKVSLIERLDVSLMLNFVYLFKFSLILSYITTVSFIEYPTIVSTAAMIERLTSNDKIEKSLKAKSLTRKNMKCFDATNTDMIQADSTQRTQGIRRRPHRMSP